MQMVKLSFRLLLAFGIFCIATNFCFAQEISDPLYRANELYEEFYKKGVIHDAEVFQTFEEIQNQLPTVIQSQEQEELFVLYLRYGLLLSSYYAFANDKNHLLLSIQEFDKRVEAILKGSSFSADVYLAYADYLYSKVSWEKKSAPIVQALPILYRRASIASDNPEQRVKAVTKLALWYANPANANTSLWNAFIEAQDENIELLSAVDRFMGYLTMSMYYMRTYQVQKGWDYLGKAQEIFPDNMLIIIMQFNYSKGVFSWLD